MAHANNNKDHYSSKHPIFDGEKSDYWKDRIKNLFIYCDAYLCDMVIDGYTYPTYANGTKLEITKIDEQQKKDHKNFHRSRTTLLNVISYSQYEKITNRDSAKSIFNSLRITHEGNEQVKESKAMALFHKY